MADPLAAMGTSSALAGLVAVIEAVSSRWDGGFGLA